MAVELLAPAGSKAALNAAVRAGADAVYLGLENFNARHGADNFTLFNLPQMCDYCHLRGVKVYITVNTIIITREVSDVLKMVEGAYLAGADAFIVQDIGLAKLIAETYGKEFVHISTQMNIHSLAGVDAAHLLGAGRITLARELNLNEIREICNYAHELDMEIETFVHGAICICYSGQCFMSSMIGGRSANRGMCAQACRLPYELLLGKDKKSVGRAAGDHLLSPKDMCNIDYLTELMEAGVDSFKIEGRMKSPEYVSSVVGVYRKTIDSGRKATSEDRNKLASSFSRGFTDGYLRGEHGNDFMSYQRPNNRGVFVGRVKAINREIIELATEKDLRRGDSINIWTKHGGAIVEIDENCKLSKGKACLPNTKQLRDVRVSDRVFRVRSASDEFIEDFSETRLSVRAKLKFRIGEPLNFEVSCNGAVYECSGQIVETARTKAVSEKDVIEHFDRLGNTDFVLEDVEVELDDNVGIGFSQIHKLRTQALEGLKSKLTSSERLLGKHLSSPKVNKFSKKNQGLKIGVIVTSPENARAALKAGVDVYVPAINFGKGTATYSGVATQEPSQTTYPDDVKIIMPLVSRGKVDFSQYLTSGGGVLCEDIATFLRAKSESLDADLGQMVPVTNILDADLINRLEPCVVWLSPELNLAQIKDVASQIYCDLGLYAFGRQRLMTTEHCELMSAGDCDEDCKNCRRRLQPAWLKDRKDIDFPIMTDISGKTTIYNSVDLDAMPYFSELIDAGISRFMIDATFMNKETMLSIISRAKDSLSTPPQKRLKNTTSGHLFRGV